ncbi:hypothetical protein DRQ09_02735 [candidate division KSB1 bacterium]|nr:MAG: hypothetical protein DRQ09_02735 [candidate division KSB1 bacterium]
MKRKHERAKKPYKIVKVDPEAVKSAIKKAKKNEAKWKWIGRADLDELEDVDLSIDDVSN